MSFSPDTTKAVTVQERLQIHSVTEIARIMNRILSVAQNNLTRAQSNMIKQANHQCHRENFVIEDEVIINIQNFVSNQPIKALNDKKHKPFKILKQFHFSYKLNISSE